MKRLPLILIIITLLFFSNSYAEDRIPDVSGTTWFIESNEVLIKSGGCFANTCSFEQEFFDYKITFSKPPKYTCTMRKDYYRINYNCPKPYRFSSQAQGRGCYTPNLKYLHIPEAYVPTVKSSYKSNLYYGAEICYWKQKGKDLTWSWAWDFGSDRIKSSAVLEDRFLSGHIEYSNDVIEIQGKGLNIKTWNEVARDSSGTGFFINKSGHIATNNHVIDKCKTINVHYKGKKEPVKVLAHDSVNDLAILESKILPEDFFIIAKEDVGKLEKIYVAGFPFGKSISSDIKVTEGIVSSIMGIGDNYSNIQIDAALQAGNSGGPVVNTSGEVVAVAFAKLDFEKIYEMYGDIPENTNFGIKSSILRTFLNINGIDLPSSSFFSRLLNMFSSSEEIVRDKVNKATVYLECKNK